MIEQLKILDGSSDIYVWTSITEGKLFDYVYICDRLYCEKYSKILNDKIVLVERTEFIRDNLCGLIMIIFQNVTR